ncbi:MAG: hypothetical protein IJF92_00060 [Bacilli bacterium]|nr:hypothetical protein [Bacilli bacterium]
MDCHWYAVRLVELEGYTALQNKVNNPDSAPTENSTNLVTSGGVYEAIQNATKVFIGTEAEWEAETEKTKYQLAVLTDKTQIDAVDETTGDIEIVADKTKRFTGLRSEWEALTATEKAEYEIVCLLDDIEDASSTIFATISSENAAVTIGDHICSKNGKNVCVMLKGHTNGVVAAATKMFSGFFNPLVPDNYPYLDIPFAIRNRTTNVTEMRMGYLNAAGDFYTSAYTENIESDWDIQLLFSYQTEN